MSKLLNEAPAGLKLLVATMVLALTFFGVAFSIPFPAGTVKEKAAALFGIGSFGLSAALVLLEVADYKKIDNSWTRVVGFVLFLLAIGLFGYGAFRT
ncbi:hypothetical protein [Falsirhodobacter xinxiangensis]|uniref:hypothetical protein n=1 Tax=Falsirhodobacter xinxiangensis TaxID=2530049 RepID=UPI0010AA8B90|nr:hypothetical protein [Rhodobacter xinxiangensis]